jgi:putative flippase GtrA
MEKLLTLLKKYKEIIMYLIFGVMTTAVSLLVYSLAVKLFFFGITAASAVSWVIAVSFAFVTNKLFVFESRSREVKTVLREAVSFFAARIVSGVVEIFLPELLFIIGLDFSLFGVKGIVAKIIVNLIVIIMNYIFSKLFVFKKAGD